MNIMFDIALILEENLGIKDISCRTGSDEQFLTFNYHWQFDLEYDDIYLRNTNVPLDMYFTNKNSYFDMPRKERIDRIRDAIMDIASEEIKQDMKNIKEKQTEINKLEANIKRSKDLCANLVKNASVR